MALDSTSTLVEIEAAYDDSASYEEDRSVAKCRAFITAVRLLLRRYRRKIQRGSGTAIENDVAPLKAELQRAQTWLAQHDTSATGGGGSVRFASFENFRD